MSISPSAKVPLPADAASRQPSSSAQNTGSNQEENKFDVEGVLLHRDLEQTTSPSIKARSISQVADALNTPESLKKMSGFAWDCVRVEAGPNGGHVRIYRPNPTCNPKKSQYDSVIGRVKITDPISKKFVELEDQFYPAIEVPQAILYEIFPEAVDSSLEGSVGSELDYIKIFRDLGIYKIVENGETYAHFPDREALLANWEAVKGKYGITHNLDIMPSDGIASHIDFIKAIRDHDVLLSSDKEFFHDMAFHVMPTIGLIVSCNKADSPKTYQEIREIQRKNIDAHLGPIELLGRIKEKFAGKLHLLPKSIQELIERIPVLEGGLGAYVDTIASKSQSIDRTVDFDSYHSEAFFPEYVNKCLYNNVFKSDLPRNPDGNLQWQIWSLADRLQRAVPVLEYLEKMDTSAIAKCSHLGQIPLSGEQVKSIPPTHEELVPYSGALWECVDRIPAEQGSYLIFRASEGYDAGKNKTDSVRQKEIVSEAFPYSEPTTDQVDITFKSYPRGELGKREASKKSGETKETPPFANCWDAYSSERFRLSELVDSELDAYNYYSFLGNFIVLPDKEALLAKWKAIQQRYGFTSNLEFVSTDTIEDPIERIKAFRDHPFVLNDNHHFVSDYVNYVLPAISALWQHECTKSVRLETLLKWRKENVNDFLEPLEGLLRIADKVKSDTSDLPETLQSLLKKREALTLLVLLLASYQKFVPLVDNHRLNFLNFSEFSKLIEENFPPSSMTEINELMNELYNAKKLIEENDPEKKK